MIEVFFSGTTDINSLIQGLIQKAQKSIYFAMFALTNRDFIDLLKDVSQNNIVVNGIVDQEQIYNSREILFDLMNFRDTHIKAIGSRDSRMHHKFIVIDEYITITGSFNWTYQANLRNSENIIFIKDKLIASEYIEEFRRLENKISGALDMNTIKKFEEDDISKLLLEEPYKNTILYYDGDGRECIRRVDPNTIVYFDEDGKEYITRVNPKDVISYPDERGNPSKKYLRVII